MLQVNSQDIPVLQVNSQDIHFVPVLQVNSQDIHFVPVLQVNSSVFCNHLVIPVEFLGPGHYEYGCRAVLNGSMLNSSSILKVVGKQSLKHCTKDLVF